MCNSGVSQEMVVMVHSWVHGKILVTTTVCDEATQIHLKCYQKFFHWSTIIIVISCLPPVLHNFHSVSGFSHGSTPSFNAWQCCLEDVTPFYVLICAAAWWLISVFLCCRKRLRWFYMRIVDNITTKDFFDCIICFVWNFLHYFDIRLSVLEHSRIY